MDLTGDKENFSKLTEVILTIVPKYLRQYFKDKWDKKFPQNIWIDSIADGQFLTSKLKCRYPFTDLKKQLERGNRCDWDSTALLFVLCSTDVVIPGCRAPPHRTQPLRQSENLAELRQIRNDFFAHRVSASIPTTEFNKVISDIEKIFTILNWQNGLQEVESVKQSLIVTPLSKQIQEQLDAAIELNKGYHKYYTDLEKNLKG